MSTRPIEPLTTPFLNPNNHTEIRTPLHLLTDAGTLELAMHARLIDALAAQKAGLTIVDNLTAICADLQRRLQALERTRTVAPDVLDPQPPIQNVVTAPSPNFRPVLESSIPPELFALTQTAVDAWDKFELRLDQLDTLKAGRASFESMLEYVNTLRERIQKLENEATTALHARIDKCVQTIDDLDQRTEARLAAIENTTPHKDPHP